MMSSAAIAAANPSFDLLPREAGGGVPQQIGLSSGQLLPLPIVDWHCLGSGCKVVPQVFYELQLLRGTQVKDRCGCRIHPEHSSKILSKRWEKIQRLNNLALSGELRRMEFS